MIHARRRPRKDLDRRALGLPARIAIDGRPASG
jgi:hypothetical protein